MFILVSSGLLLSYSVVSDSLRSEGLWPARLLCPCPWNYPSRTDGVGCHVLLQRIFPTQGSVSPAAPALAGGFFTTEPPRKWIETRGNEHPAAYETGPYNNYLTANVNSFEAEM